jgi:photosystem II stability/assembly factor-like uncharacterized protein
MAANPCRHVTIKRNTMNNYKLNILSLIFLLPFVSEAQWVEILNYKDEPSGGRVQNLAFVDGKVGFFLHKLEYVMKTDDFGESWDTVFTRPYNLTGVQFINDTVGYVQSTKPNPNNFYKTIDQGITWTGIDGSPNIDFVFTSHFVNDTLGYAIDYSPPPKKVVYVQI